MSGRKRKIHTDWIGKKMRKEDREQEARERHRKFLTEVKRAADANPHPFKTDAVSKLDSLPAALRPDKTADRIQN